MNVLSPTVTNKVRPPRIEGFPATRLPDVSRERFLNACRCRQVDRPPMWLMRQAGRALPEYRALRERYSFLDLVRTPDLAAEVTLQPVRRFGFDAAIIFSDILVIPEAMGIGYSFRDSGGVSMDSTIKSAADITKLSVDGVAERLGYVVEAIKLVRSMLGGGRALLGFAGSPWTLANFMLDGGSAKEHTAALRLFREDRAAFEELCERLSEAIILFLRAQIRAGVDAIQIFDSLGGLIPENEFRAASGVWIREIIARLGGAVPVIVFSKGTRDWLSILEVGADVIGVDHEIPLREARRRIPSAIGIQGNLPPDCLVNETPEEVGQRVQRLLAVMRDRKGYIFNLGHGLLPGARLENVQAIVNAIRGAV